MVWGLPGRCQPSRWTSLLCLPSPQGNTVESEHLSELTEEEYEAHYIRRQDLKGFLWLDAKYLNPFFTRRLTQEVGHGPGPGQGSLAFLPRGLQWPRVRWAPGGPTCYVGRGSQASCSCWLSPSQAHRLASAVFPLLPDLVLV